MSKDELLNIYHHSKTYHMKKDYKSLKLHKLRYRRLRGVMIETYKLMTGKYDHKLVNFMPKQHDSSTSLPTRGHQLKLYRQRAEKNLRNNFFSLRVTSYWNSLHRQCCTGTKHQDI